MTYAGIDEERLPRLLNDARRVPVARDDVRFPDWYFRQWHFCRDGYLSRAAVDRYERLIQRLYNAGRAGAINRALTHEARQRAPGSIVELGCGPGRLLAELARNLTETPITGLDLSPFMLDRAAARTATAANVRVVHQDASVPGALPRDTGLVLAVHVFGHIPRKVAGAIMTEAADAVADDGALLTVDHRWHRPPPLPAALTPWRRRSLLGGMLTLREYRRLSGGKQPGDDVAWAHCERD